MPENPTSQSGPRVTLTRRVSHAVALSRRITLGRIFREIAASVAGGSMAAALVSRANHAGALLAGSSALAALAKRLRNIPAATTAAAAVAALVKRIRRAMPSMALTGTLAAGASRLLRVAGAAPGQSIVSAPGKRVRKVPPQAAGQSSAAAAANRARKIAPGAAGAGAAAAAVMRLRKAAPAIAAAAGVGMVGEKAGGIDLLSGLVAYWKLDEAGGSAIDSVGSNDLSDINSAGSGTGHVYSTARDFEDNSNTHMTLSSSDDLKGGDVNLCGVAWFTRESTPVHDRLFTYGDVSGNAAWRLLTTTPSTTRFVRFAVSSTGSGFDGDVTEESGAIPSNNTFYMVYFYHDADNNEIGISVNDGTVVTASYSSGIFSGDGPFVLGGEYSGGAHNNTQDHDGKIGPVAIWRGRILSSEEVTALYNSGAGLALEDF